jgi:hypothetical protein
METLFSLRLFASHTRRRAQLLVRRARVTTQESAIPPRVE